MLMFRQSVAGNATFFKYLIQSVKRACGEGQVSDSPKRLCLQSKSSNTEDDEDDEEDEDEEDGLLEDEEELWTWKTCFTRLFEGWLLDTEHKALAQIGFVPYFYIDTRIFFETRMDRAYCWSVSYVLIFTAVPSFNISSVMKSHFSCISSDICRSFVILSSYFCSFSGSRELKTERQQ